MRQLDGTHLQQSKADWAALVMRHMRISRCPLTDDNQSATARVRCLPAPSASHLERAAEIG